MDIISEHIDNMTLDQLKHNARMALLAEAYTNADVDGPTDDRADYARDALARVTYGAVRITYAAYDQAAQFGDKPDDVISANWERRLLNIVPLNDEWEEQDPDTFIGYLWDNHTLPRPPLDVCGNYAARMPWVQTNLLHGPRYEDHPVRRRLELELSTAEDQCRRGFAHAEVRDRARENLAGFDRQHLAALAVFTANLPDELFIP